MNETDLTETRRHLLVLTLANLVLGAGIFICAFAFNARINALKERVNLLEADQHKSMEYTERITDVLLKMQRDLGYVSTNSPALPTERKVP